MKVDRPTGTGIDLFDLFLSNYHTKNHFTSRSPRLLSNLETFSTYFRPPTAGAFNTVNTPAQTATIANPPVVYATSLPANQNNEQNNTGPAALPTCPQLLNRPKTTPRSPSLASKLPRLFRLVTTVALVIASRPPAPYSPDSVDAFARRKNEIVQATTPARNVVSGFSRRTTVPWSREAMRPIMERRRPLRAEGLAVVFVPA